MSINIDGLMIRGATLLAPMSGITDAPFRRLARRFGAGLVVTEMIASRGVIEASREAARKLRHEPDEGPLVVQLAGAEPEPIGEAARLCQDLGAAMIDINMGCPAKKVANGQLAGAALMRDESRALGLIEAAVAAVRVPVSLKMRLGWDESRINAPRLARLAEAAGVRLITVHGRTRRQGFGGRADWDAIAEVKQAVAVPVVANGDVESLDDAAEILRRSGADGVMVGRGAYGRPWFPGQVADFLESGQCTAEPALAEQAELALEHLDALRRHYGDEIGGRVARKHLGWYLARAGIERERRAEVQREERPERVEQLVAAAYRTAAERWAA
jgi:tRNA-dihydrouridine synthase B